MKKGNIQGYVKAINQETREVDFVASVQEVDRDGDIVFINGIDLVNYNKNPIILVDHEYEVESAIGTCTSITKLDNALNVTIKFGQNIGDYAEEVYNKVLQGIVRALSIGFRVKEYKQATRDNGRVGWDITQCELLEISLVVIPANANALKKGCDEETPVPDMMTKLDAMHKMIEAMHTKMCGDKPKDIDEIAIEEKTADEVVEVVEEVKEVDQTALIKDAIKKILMEV